MDNHGPDIKLTRVTKFFRGHIFTKLFCLILLVFGINLFLRKNEQFADAYTQWLNYNQLYVDQDKLHIKTSRLDGDSVEIELQGAILHEGKNEVTVLSGNRLISARQVFGKKIKFKPLAGQVDRLAMVINGDADTIFLDVDYDPKTGSGSREENQYEFTTNTLVNPGQLNSVQDWVIRGWGDEPAGIREETQRILNDSIRIAAHERSTEKILKLASFILQRTYGHEGAPSDELSRMHPLKQLRYAEAGKSKLWCGNFSSIFSFLASSAGLPVRLVSSGKIEGAYSNGIHVFCEVYLKEEQEWVYVDLTSRNILTRYHRKWLNAIDVQRLLRYPIVDTGWVAWHYEKDSLFETPFYKVAALPAYYFHANSRFVFYYGDFLQIMEPKNIFRRASKFFYTRPYYATYSDNARMVNFALYCRIFSGYLFVLLLLLFLFRLIKNSSGWF